MKKVALIIISAVLFAMVSCVSHKTCPTYMKNTTGTEVISASAR